MTQVLAGSPPHRIPFVALPLSLGLWLCLALALAACGADDNPGAGDESCLCTGEAPADDLCEVQFTLPATCDSAAAVTVAGTPTCSAAPGSTFTSCSVPVAEGESAEVALSGVVAATGQAQCRTGGSYVAPDFCTIRLALGDSCAGIEGRESAAGFVDGVEVGTITIEDPLVPCIVISSGDSVEASIRSGTDLVLTNTISCRPPGGELSMFMECSVR